MVLLTWFIEFYVKNIVSSIKFIQKKTSRFSSEGLWRLAATYSPTWYSSTIGANGLNFSVRDGKRWIPVAITTIIYRLMLSHCVFYAVFSHSIWCKREKKCQSILLSCNPKGRTLHNWSVGLLVPLDFDITAFTSAAYQRGSLPRPYMEISSRG